VAWWLVDGKTVQNGGSTFVLQNVTANHTVSVSFEMLAYTLTPSAGANGTISPNVASNVTYGSSKLYTAAPATGYYVAWWLVDGKTVQNGGSKFVLQNVTANHTVSVSFEILTYTLTPFAGSNGTISPNFASNVIYGASKLYTAAPATGYHVAWWLVDGKTVQNGGSTLTLQNVTANHTVSVTFDVLTYTLTPTSGANGTVSPNTVKTVTYGSSVLFTAIPNSGYTVGQWTVDGIAAQTGGGSFKLPSVTSSHLVGVTFILS
jgi:hypothetical protein